MSAFRQFLVCRGFGSYCRLPRGEVIPGQILQSPIVVLATVQRFPEERLALIETDGGVCSLVAWSHLLLGLSV